MTTVIVKNKAKRVLMGAVMAAGLSVGAAEGIYDKTDLSWKSTPPKPDPLSLAMNAGAKIPFVRPLPAYRDAKGNFFSDKNDPEWAMPGVFTGTDRDLGFFMKKPAKLLLNGRETPFRTTDVFGSAYVDLTVAPENGVADFEILY